MQHSGNIASHPESPSTPSEPPRFLQNLLAGSAVRFNGRNPWDPQIHDQAAYARMLLSGSLGFGESYVDGQWDCEALDECVARLLRHGANRRLHWLAQLRFAGAALVHLLTNPQSMRRAFVVGERHYDLGNDLFEAMLDPTMSYSCGYWATANDLAAAQRHKLDLICRKLELQPGERLLDIGCGWGGLAHHAAMNYGVSVTGITISREQAQYARQLCGELPVDIILADYRALTGTFDKVVSVGMFEHVGPANYVTYLDKVRHLLTDAGLFLLHTIGGARSAAKPDPWLDRYIFPNGRLPSARRLASALEERFTVEDWHNFGPDYDRTLLAWWRNFKTAWPHLRPRYGDRFYRLWRYYLLACAGFFRSRQGQLWQLVLSKPGRAVVYRSVR